MPSGFTFRPNQLKSASQHSKRILECLQCGNVAKKGSANNPKNRGYVGCRNNRLLGQLGRLDSTPDRLRFVASYYSRLGEHFRLQGEKVAAEGPAWRSLAFRSRDELSGLKELLYQSMFTTIQAHFKTSRTRILEKYGKQPMGGCKVPSEERPRMFRAEIKRFRPWVCVREGGCCLGDDQQARMTDVATVSKEVEEPILTQLRVDRDPRRFQTLEKNLDMDQAALILNLRRLHREGKVKLNPPAENPNEIHSIELTPAGLRRYWHYHNQLSLELEHELLQLVLGENGKNHRRFITLEQGLDYAGKLRPLLTQLREEGKVSLPDLDEQPRRPAVRLTNVGRRRLLHLQQQGTRTWKKGKPGRQGRCGSILGTPLPAQHGVRSVASPRQ